MKNDSTATLNQLLPIKTDDAGTQLVSARALYTALGLDSANWARWERKNISGNDFAVVGEDFTEFFPMKSGGLESKVADYALKLEFAKRLAMMARTEAGEKIRAYFLECERRAAPAALPSDPLALALHAALENRKDIAVLGERVKDVEIALANAPIDSAQVGIIYRLGQQLGQVMGSYPQAWRLFKNHYQIASYRDLQSSKFDVARRFLEIQISSYTGQNALVTQ